MNPDDNDSTRKLAIVSYTKDDGSQWIEVLLLKFAKPGELVPRFVPSFHDLFRIVRGICACEDAKYPPPQYQGRYKVLDFLRDAILARSDDAFDALAQKYKIPERDRGQLVTSNGARLERVARPQPALTAEDIRW
jgi:hypothetical protein